MTTSNMTREQQIAYHQGARDAFECLALRTVSKMNGREMGTRAAKLADDTFYIALVAHEAACRLEGTR